MEVGGKQVISIFGYHPVRQRSAAIEIRFFKYFKSLGYSFDKTFAMCGSRKCQPTNGSVEDSTSRYQAQQLLL